jgi:hypothetical protein
VKGFVTTGSISTLLWIVALLAGWLAATCLVGSRYAIVKFRAFLKTPLFEEVEHLTHIWER